MYSYGPPHMAVQKQDDRHEHTFSSYVRIRDVVLKTYLGRWTIGRSDERGSRISVLPARYDDDDDTANWSFSFPSNYEFDIIFLLGVFLISHDLTGLLTMCILPQCYCCETETYLHHGLFQHYITTWDNTLREGVVS